MNELFISLGHNSSAVAARNNVIVAGYEQERIDRVKSSSAYPRDAIELALQESKMRGVETAYVSHWFDHFDLKQNKYLDIAHLRSVASKIVGLTPEFTHHDAHANAALGFLDGHDRFDEPSYVVVVDGFGSLQECFSFYYAIPGKGARILKHRSYGYNMSLGLMYQYTTESLGMKPNQDEYKLLGYEAHILEYVSREHAERVRNLIRQDAEAHAERMLLATLRPYATDELIDYEALKTAKARWMKKALDWRSLFPSTDDQRAIRVCVAFCAQAFIEYAVNWLLTELIPVGSTRPIVLTGGCFYNVKLNRSIQQRPNKPSVFAHPLAGDQGASLGLSSTLPVNRLTLGRRLIGAKPVYDLFGQDDTETVFVVVESQWPQFASMFINDNRIVNVVRGSMEYGPRALCNTTTFALPTKENVSRINILNDRDDAMPMAPVMTQQAAMRLLNPDELGRVIVSDQYMITTIAFDQQPTDALMGVAHKDPLADTWTARPQIIKGDDYGLHGLLRSVPDETLINTSYNYHGEPIIYSHENAVRTHTLQVQRARLYGIQPPITVLVKS